MNQRNDQSVAHQAADEVDTVADGVRSAAHSVTDRVQSAARSVRDAGGRAVSAVEETCHDANQFARNSIQRTRARARSLEHDFEGAVAARPVVSLLIAAGVGLVLGVLWHRRRL